MFWVQVVGADGSTILGKSGFHEAYEAEELVSRLHRSHASSGKYASFQVLDEDGTVYSEMEC
tara:strand:- start:1983 stop:2168 length:186 start_codon:yes stop_codon:yes gene_type:complete